MDRQTGKTIDALGLALARFERVAVAVSGGIDSLTLATLAARSLRERAEMFHSLTASVPGEATARTRELAARYGWRLRVIDANEFSREAYVSNPVNRCFFCKQSLYAEIARHTSAQILSGANANDLGEYRPGLDAARDAAVRHPFVEQDVDKAMIRQMARALGLGELSEIPASPCLSSRVETGIGITPELLQRVHAAENAIKARLAAAAVRCRVRGSGIVIELDAAALDLLTPQARQELAGAVGRIFAPGGSGPPPAFAPYRVGSAFLVQAHDRARHTA